MAEPGKDDVPASRRRRAAGEEEAASRPEEERDRLAPARGALAGTALSVLFWAALGLVVWALR